MSTLRAIYSVYSASHKLANPPFVDVKIMLFPLTASPSTATATASINNYYNTCRGTKWSNDDDEYFVLAYFVGIVERVDQAGLDRRAAEQSGSRVKDITSREGNRKLSEASTATARLGLPVALLLVSSFAFSFDKCVCWLYCARLGCRQRRNCLLVCSSARLLL